MMDEAIVPTAADVEPLTVGLVGTGRMGSALGRNLLADGHKLLVFSRSPGGSDALEAAGAVVTRDLAGMAECDAVFTSLPDDDALGTVTLGAGGLVASLRADAIHISTSTVSPSIASKVEAMHHERGQSFVSAPILGNPDLVAARAMFFILSGNAHAAARVRPLLERLSARVFTVGEAAADASLIKLAGNVLTAATLQSMAEVIALVRKAGIDPRLAFDVFTGSLFDGKVHKAYGGKILDQRYAPAGMTLPLAAKDLGLALSEADRLAVAMPATALIRDRFETAIDQGWSNLDWSALGLLAAHDAGLDEAVPAQ